MTQITITYYDQYGRFQATQSLDDSFLSTVLVGHPYAVGYVIGDYDHDLFYYNGSAVVSATDLSPSISAYQILADGSTTTTISSLPKPTEVLVDSPTDVGLNYQYFETVTDGSFTFSTPVQGVYSFELKTPGKFPYVFEIQAGSADLLMDLETTSFSLLTMFANLAPIKPSLHSYVWTTESPVITYQRIVVDAMSYAMVDSGQLVINDIRVVMGIDLMTYAQTNLAPAIIQPVIVVPDLWTIEWNTYLGWTEDELQIFAITWNDPTIITPATIQVVEDAFTMTMEDVTIM